MISEHKMEVFEKIKLINHQPGSLRRKQSTQIKIIRNESGEITTITTVIEKNQKRRLCGVIHQPNGHPKEMDRFLETYNLLRNEARIKTI